MGDADFELYFLLNQIDNQNNLNNLLNIQHIEQIQNGNIRLRRSYRIRNRIDPFTEYNEKEFKCRFRFTKHEVHQIYNLIDGDNTLEPKVSSFCFIGC